MKKVMVFGAFDGLHPGHLNFFKQAKEFGDFLIVSVARDVNVKKTKGKTPLFGEEERLKLVENLKIVDKATIGAVHDYFVHIQMYNPDVICLGYDQWPSEKYVRENLDKVGLFKTEVVRLEPYKPKTAKSTIVKEKSVDY